MKISDNMKAYLSDAWEFAHEVNKGLIEELVGHTGGVLLDYGCGDGSFTQRVASVSRARRAIGIEIDSGQIREVENHGIELIVADLNESLPIDDEQIDVIVANQVIEHVYNTDNSLSPPSATLTRAFSDAMNQLLSDPLRR